MLAIYSSSLAKDAFSAKMKLLIIGFFAYVNICPVASLVSDPILRVSLPDGDQGAIDCTLVVSVQAKQTAFLQSQELLVAEFTEE
jgi:hypothetical protein